MQFEELGLLTAIGNVEYCHGLGFTQPHYSAQLWLVLVLDLFVMFWF